MVGGGLCGKVPLSRTLQGALSCRRVEWAGGKGDRCGELAWPLAPVHRTWAAVPPRATGRPRVLGMGGSSFPFFCPTVAASLLSQGSGDSGDSRDSGSWRQVLASRFMSDCGVREASFQLRWSSGVVCSWVSVTVAEARLSIPTSRCHLGLRPMAPTHTEDGPPPLKPPALFGARLQPWGSCFEGVFCSHPCPAHLSALLPPRSSVPGFIHTPRLRVSWAWQRTRIRLSLHFWLFTPCD